jgi:hypothetical protein
MSGQFKANLVFDPSLDRPDHMADGAVPIYKNAGRGMGNYALGREPDWVSRSAPPVGLHRFAQCAGLAGAMLAMAAFMFGACDAIATGDSLELAQDRVFFTLQELLVNGPHALALSVFGSPDALGFFGALVSAAGFCIAALTAEVAGLGAMVATTTAHLLHLGGL